MSKLTIIGSGNIGLSLAKGLVKSGQYQAEDIVLTRPSLYSFEAEKSLGFRISANHVEAITGDDVIVLAVLPQQIRKVMEEIAVSVHSQQIVISVASGVTC